MTAEILIMNNSAIAMAADSAVTVGNKKTYTGVNKLFMLSNNPPMGIMIFGNANFEIFPMETLIKEFRKTHNFKKLGNIEKIHEKFIEYLSKVVPPTNFKAIIDYNINSFHDFLENKFFKIDKDHFEEFINSYKHVDHLNFLFEINEFDEYNWILKVSFQILLMKMIR